jgi:hypothetical protein
MLYESAVASIKTWKFRPLTWNGAPVEVELNRWCDTGWPVRRRRMP